MHFLVRSLDLEGYIEDVLRERSPNHKKWHSNWKENSESFIQDVIDIRGKVEAFLNECLQEILSHLPRIVAFTSIFQQQVAALSLAKRIKAQSPETLILFGGANCEGIMGVEMVLQFPFIDAVVSGEGDIIFPELVLRIIEKKSFSDLQGIYTRDNINLMSVNNKYLNAPSVSNMDGLPYLDYDDFFQQLEIRHPSLDKRYKPRLLFETSRGCWWGEKNHCTFCGLNGSTITYRSKSAQRALDELMYLTSRYPGCSVSVVDNILDMKYFKEFVPELAARQMDLELFYEVKSNLKKEQVHLLKNAGITAIQPGIESFSSRVLQIMRKGVTGLQNIQLLKWCKELGITPSYNILWGFPGEPPEEYDYVADLIPLLTHLQPPCAATTIRLDRFSPNFDHSEQFGFVQVEPFPSYRYIYPLTPESITNLAYYFTFEYRELQDVESYTKPVRELIVAWKEVYETSDLFSVDKGSELLIWDLRPAACRPLEILTGLQRVLYIACDHIHTTYQIKQLAEKHSGTGATASMLDELLQPLLERGLMLRDGDAYLSLAIPLGEYSPEKVVLKQFQEIVRTMGKESGGKVVIDTNQNNIRKEFVSIS